MSQLDFDKRPEAMAKPSNPTKDQITEILDAPSVQETAASAVKKPAAAATEMKENATARASLATPPALKPNGEPVNFDWVKPQEGSAHFLIPRLKGPFVDPTDKKLISSTATWKRGKAGCADVHSEEQVCGKAKALKDLMSKFTGSDDFFQSQCPQSCLHTTEVAVLSGFAVKKVPDGDYKMSETNGRCRYEIQSHAEPAHWQMLEGERGVCSCVPKTCMQ